MAWRDRAARLRSAVVARLAGLRGNRDRTEFLPAALEVMETPPPVLPRAILWTILAALVLGLGWAWWGRLDVVAVASGRIIPAGRVKIVQPLESGRVAALHVTEGERVREGQALVELDPTEAAADVARLKRERAEAEIEAARLAAFLAAMDGREPKLQLPDAAAADRSVIALHYELLTSQLAEYRARLLTLDGELAERQAEAETIRAELARLTELLPLVTKRADAQNTLAASGAAPDLRAVQVEQERVSMRRSVDIQKARLLQAEAAVETRVAGRVRLEAETRRATLEALADARRRADALGQELAKAVERENSRILVAPVAGTVQQLQVTAVGQVVTPAQPLMVVVPDDAVLEVEARIPNKDVGFVREGQRAAIKVETFPFTRYGLIDGTIRLVARDAVTPESQDREAVSPLYLARVALDRTTMDVDGRAVPLSPGMAVTVEIKTGTRRVIEFLFDPLVRAGREALRER